MGRAVHDILDIAMLWGLLVHISIWVRQNPALFVAGFSALVTASGGLYAYKYAKTADDQLAAAIAPEIKVTTENGCWQGNDFRATLVITTSKNSLILKEGHIHLRCEHGSIRVASQLEGWAEQSLLPGEPFKLVVSAPFRHPFGTSHRDNATLEGYLVFSDSRSHSDYFWQSHSGGLVRRGPQRKVGRIRRAISRRLWSLRMRLMVWQSVQHVKAAIRTLPQSRRGSER